MLKNNLALIGQVISEKKMFDNTGYIRVFIPGTGADNPLQGLEWGVQASRRGGLILFVASHMPS